MEEIKINRKSKVYKDMNASANQMYNDYVLYIENKHQGAKQPMVFKQWLEYAKNRGVIENIKVEEAEVNTEEAEGSTSIQTKSNAGKWVIGSLVTLTLATILIALTKKNNGIATVTV